MFIHQMMKQMTYKPVKSTNSYNETIVTYQEEREIDIAIVPSVHTYQGNDNSILNGDLAGITKTRVLERGWAVDTPYGRAIVTYVEENRLYSIIHLQLVDSDGTITRCNN